MPEESKPWGHQRLGRLGMEPRPKERQNLNPSCFCRWLSSPQGTLKSAEDEPLRLTARQPASSPTCVNIPSLFCPLLPQIARMAVGLCWAPLPAGRSEGNRGSAAVSKMAEIQSVGCLLSVREVLGLLPSTG